MSSDFGPSTLRVPIDPRTEGRLATAGGEATEIRRPPDHPTYGLAASVLASDPREALHAVGRIEAGMVWANRNGRAPGSNLPPRGVDAPSFGQGIGGAGLEASLRAKAA